MKRSKRKPLSHHHIRPKCRIPHGEDKDTDNIVQIPQDFHSEWHDIFGVLTLEEIHQFIEIIMRPGRRWTWNEIKDIRECLMSERRRKAA